MHFYFLPAAFYPKDSACPTQSYFPIPWHRFAWWKV